MTGPLPYRRRVTSTPVTAPRPAVVVLGCGGHAVVCIDILTEVGCRLVGVLGDISDGVLALGVPAREVKKLSPA